MPRRPPFAAALAMAALLSAGCGPAAGPIPAPPSASSASSAASTASSSSVAAPTVATVANVQASVQMPPQRNARTGWFLDATHGWLAGTLCPWNSGAPCTGWLDATSDGGISWQSIWTGTGAPTSLTFVSPTEGWMLATTCATCTTDALFRTVDGGRRWTALHTGAGGVLGPMAFADARHGWVGVNATGPQNGKGALLATTNGGATWRGVALPCPDLAAISFVSPQDGFAACAGEPGAGMQEKQVYSTTDGGARWTLLAHAAIAAKNGDHGITDAGYVSDLAFSGTRDGWMALARYGLLHSADGGATWQAAPDPQPLRSATWVQPEPGGALFALFRGALDESMDGGASWRQLYPAPDPAQPVDFVSGEAGVAAAATAGAPRILKTTDGGEHWGAPLTVPGKAPVWNLSFADAAHGWVVDGSGLWATSDGGAQWHAEELPAAGHVQIDLRTASDGHVLVTASRDLYATSDGGKSWTLVARAVPVAMIDFLTAETAWGSGAGGVYRTADGGRTWQRVLATKQGGQPEFLSADTGFVTGCGGILATRDGGATWTDIRWPPDVVQCTVASFATPRAGVATMAGGGPLLATTDGGRTWEPA